MKDLLEKLGLAEIFAFLAPGAVVLVAFIACWITPDVVPPGLKALLKNAGILGAAALIASYALGLFAAAWSNEGAELFLRMSGNRRHLPFKLQRTLGFAVVWLFHWLPLPRYNDSIVDSLFRMTDALEAQAGLHGLTRIQSPWDLLALYRTVISGTLADSAAPILTAADSIHRRLLFCLGAALGFLLAGFQALARLVAGLAAQVPATVRPAALLAVTAGGVMASFALRYIAGRWWQEELLLTCGLTQARRKPS